MQIEYFGKLNDIAGVNDHIICDEILPLSIDDIIEILTLQNPKLGEILTQNSIKFILNDIFVDGHNIVNKGDVLAFIPPVSGG
ncbi:hypothetical protein LPB140_00535 [Sphingorhabdus lutea]|uniref:MoaD/ThiS family protein n=1 Tax=Sphingorhabdus lutea TaxID=1913578 RepID=A0A1L3J8W7_9SPHN|nr:MoaD/ThiS family protein [Sphingorhabdus lutea]APG61579.1 hypothetical protein LPB140_00535 [Sphingorhabdus lutea]